VNPFSEDEKKFSLIAPCYGITYQHLPQWVEALSKQEYKNFEAIVVFDGPHRKGRNLLDKLIKEYKDLDIAYYTIPHGGACAARNHGAKMAKGDFLAFPSPDIYLYPSCLRIWANAFDEHPECNRVWGLYDLIREDGSISSPIGNAPTFPDGTVWYEGFKFSPFADGTFPCRANDFIGWDEDCYSLNDWEFSVRMLKRDNFKGKDWQYIPISFFKAEMPKAGGLSDDSHKNWVERKEYIQKHNGIEPKPICVSSLGAPTHGYNVSKILDAEFLSRPMFKDNNYKIIYLLGFYTGQDSYTAQSHMEVLQGFKGKKIIHWIGSDIMQLHWNCSFEKLKALKKWFKDEKVIHLCEADFTQKELAEVGIKAKIVPIPPDKLYKPLPLPEEFAVAIYSPNSELYNNDLMYEIVRSMPDVKFYFFGDAEKKGQKGDNWEQLGWIDLDEWMPKFSCNLRVMGHDGLPLTPIKFITAGRHVVMNKPLFGAIECTNSRPDIVKAVRKAQESPFLAKNAKYWQKEMDFAKYNETIRGLK
jgi:glycosyltransferase involved in cell wall biosynthesis